MELKDMPDFSCEGMQEYFKSRYRMELGESTETATTVTGKTYKTLTAEGMKREGRFSTHLWPVATIEDAVARYLFHLDQYYLAVREKGNNPKRVFFRTLPEIILDPDSPGASKVYVYSRLYIEPGEDNKHIEGEYR